MECSVSRIDFDFSAHFFQYVIIDKLAWLITIQAISFPRRARRVFVKPHLLQHALRTRYWSNRIQFVLLLLAQMRVRHAVIPLDAEKTVIALPLGSAHLLDHFFDVITVGRNEYMAMIYLCLVIKCITNSWLDLNPNLTANIVILSEN